MLETEQSSLVPGWFNHGEKILALLEQYRPMVVVELGTWLGASAIPMALSVRRWGGTVTCVDTWTGDLDEHGGHRSGGPIMLSRCAQNMIEAGVQASIRLIPATTRDAAATWFEPIDCLYVDADHSEYGCASDLDVWVPHVKPGGVIMGDDYGQALFPGVKRAWDAFGRATGITLVIYDGHAVGGGRLVYGIQQVRT